MCCYSLYKMDISVGSTHVPEYSAYQSESAPRVGNRESSKCSEEQNQSQSHAAPAQSAVRFKIRSASERQQSLTKASSFTSTCETQIASRSVKECREEMPRVHTLSPPSSDTDMIDKRRPKVLNQLDFTKKADMSETSSTTQKKPDCVESRTTKVSGRTDWRQAFVANRSKSLDWRGSTNKGGQKNQMEVIRNIKDFEGRSIQHSESLLANEAANRPSSNEMARPLKRVSLQIQPFKGTAQRKQDSNGLIASAVYGTSPVRTMALAQSFPSRLKASQSQDSTEGRKGPWHSGHSGTKPDQAEHHLKSPVTVSKVNEITRNHSVLGRDGQNVLEDNSEASSRVLHGIISSATFSSAHDTDSSFNSNNHTRRSLDETPSVSSFSNVKTVSYKPEKFGTFPKTPFKKEQMNFTTLPDNLDTMSTRSKEKPLSQDPISLVTNNSMYNERRLTGHSTGLGSHSLGRSRNRHFTAPISYSAYGLSNSINIQKSTAKEVESQVETMTSNSKQTKGMETIPGKQPHSSQEGIIPQTKPQSSQSMTADSEKHHQEHGVGLEFGSTGSPNKKAEALIENVQEPSSVSVRNKIHKFEALALQSQSPSRIQYPRRAFSVSEKPTVVASVNKTYSQRSLGIRLDNWNRECLRENLFSKSEVSNEPQNMHDLSGPVQITAQDKEGSTVKTQSRGTKCQEPGVVQTLKLPDESPSDQKNEAKFTMMNKDVDEPDSSKGSHPKSFQKLKNIHLPEEKVRNYVSSAMSHNFQKPNGITNVSHSDLKDFSPKSESKSLKSTKDKAFLMSESTPVLPHPDSSTAVKSTLLTGTSANSKSPSHLLSDSVVIPPIQVFSSASGDLSNTIKDEKVAAKVIRWIMHKGVDDENGEDDDDDDDDDEGTEREYDSDSGESSVTITSNMSNRSFSMSLVELRSLGGLDDENWMSKRTLSMSSDVSALSSVTLLDMDELECLLNDVRCLDNDDDDALEDYEDLHVVVLHKEAGIGLGFTVAGGVDQNKPMTVSVYCM
ncbi:hypothetical protein AMELA_G00083010 [Ameiurus melas]|uniref:PDZ domain-containing protein n=1 Tax=Ameiurus melas TaxID=219545 RepID=A0A7J6B0K2_AMEME|nr:hypothetical protein AMELA_G00083010 [Ameiurus melas]